MLALMLISSLVIAFILRFCGFSMPVFLETMQNICSVMGSAQMSPHGSLRLLVRNGCWWETVVGVGCWEDGVSVVGSGSTGVAGGV